MITGSVSSILRCAVTATTVGVLLSACESTAYNEQRYSSPPSTHARTVSNVQPNALPPTSGAVSPFPAAPIKTHSRRQQQPATISLQDVTKEAMVGSWKVSNGGSNCGMFLTRTNLGAGLRGGTRGCVGELASIRTWEIAGNQVILKSNDGTRLGALYKTADSRYEGSTASGQPFSLRR